MKSAAVIQIPRWSTRLDMWFSSKCKTDFNELTFGRQYRSALSLDLGNWSPNNSVKKNRVSSTKGKIQAYDCANSQYDTSRVELFSNGTSFSLYCTIHAYFFRGRFGPVTIRLKYTEYLTVFPHHAINGLEIKSKTFTLRQAGTYFFFDGFVFFGLVFLQQEKNLVQFALVILARFAREGWLLNSYANKRQWSEQVTLSVSRRVVTYQSLVLSSLSIFTLPECK